VFGTRQDATHAGGLRRSEINGVDLGRDQTQDGRGGIEIFDKGMLVTLRGKTGWREVEIGRGSSEAACPVSAVGAWMRFAKLAKGPLFRRVTGRGKFAGHSLRAGLPSSAEVDERHVEKQLGHASAEMTHKYQRQRDRFRVNLTKAAGL